MENACRYKIMRKSFMTVKRMTHPMAGINTTEITVPHSAPPLIWDITSHCQRSPHGWKLPRIDDRQVSGFKGQQIYQNF